MKDNLLNLTEVLRARCVGNGRDRHTRRALTCRHNSLCFKLLCIVFLLCGGANPLPSHRKYTKTCTNKTNFLQIFHKMFGIVKNYCDLCWRKDCLGDAPHSDRLGYSHSHSHIIGSERHRPRGCRANKIALRGFPFGAFLFPAQGERNAERRKQIVVEL